MTENISKLIISLLSGLLFALILHILLSYITCPTEVISPGSNFCDTCYASCFFTGAMSVKAVCLCLCLLLLSLWKIYHFKNKIIELDVLLFWLATTTFFIAIQIILAGEQSEILGNKLLKNSKQAISSQ